MTRLFTFVLATTLLSLQGLAQDQQTASALYESAKTGNKVAIEKITVMATGGDASAQFLLGLMYSRGEGVPKDAATVVTWYSKAAEQGYADAQFSLGLMYARGEGVPKDAATAVTWYRKAAEQGDAKPQSNLGAMYAKGEGVPKDYVQAYMWRNLAAAQGDEIAKKGRDALEPDMTREQIAEAQRLSREWKAKPK